MKLVFSLTVFLVYLNNGTEPVIAAIAMNIINTPVAHLADSFCHSPISNPVKFNNR